MWGDFNCTQHGVRDRSYGPTADLHRSSALVTLILKWNLHDSLEATLPGPDDNEQLKWFHVEHHTHDYTLAGGNGHRQARSVALAVAAGSRQPLNPESPHRQRIRALAPQIATIKRDWHRTKTQRLLRSHAWWAGQTAKQFFKRISNKFTDNFVPTLTKATGERAADPTDKADLFADSWESIMQGIPSTLRVDEGCQWMVQRDGGDVEHLAVEDFITTSAVASEIKASKPNKARGPDHANTDDPISDLVSGKRVP
ncbi:unnamed protein product [Phytophthora fragariaefolia]|uniref:Unnamed protein product n=1 Tax=Phytophthora fragariaefolia TaxID=1490495 RepID=A0A9W6YQW4_9STRA|nr:unnamed protein product [Phytophthora fragariaefolia]